jgi:hypothetical protein
MEQQIFKEKLLYSQSDSSDRELNGFKKITF